jgi:acyl-coenzyme A thioesterase PaaI-like protein
VGPHFFANFVGVSGRPAVDGRSELSIDSEPGDRPGGRVSPTALATGADLTMGAAIRNRLGPQNRLGTITLSVHHLAPDLSGPLRTSGTAQRVELNEERGFARCEVHDPAGTLVASVGGWFTALPMPPGRRLGPVPWEMPEDTPIPEVREADLEPDELATVDACTAAGQRAAARGTSVIEELLAMTWVPTAAGQVRGQLAVGPEHGNRAGHAQGGVIYGAAALAAGRAVAEGMSLAEGHLRFLRPVDGDALAVEARLLRQGRRAAFVDARLHVGAQLVATGDFTFHRIGGDWSETTR